MNRRYFFALAVAVWARGLAVDAGPTPLKKVTIYGCVAGTPLDVLTSKFGKPLEIRTPKQFPISSGLCFRFKSGLIAQYIPGPDSCAALMQLNSKSMAKYTKQKN
jgi:hypothetical protein